jgi:hypothetical protein
MWRRKGILPCDLGNYFACFLGKYFACSAKQGFELDELVCFSEVSQIHFPQGLLKQARLSVDSKTLAQLSQGTFSILFQRISKGCFSGNALMICLARSICPGRRC